jgi:hypothetical protein
VTATERAIDSAEVNCQARSMAMGVKDTVEKALGFMADFTGEVEGGTITPNTDFGISLRDAKDLEILQRMKLAGDLSRPSLWAELKRRGVLMEDFDAEAEDERLAEEGAALGIVGREEAPEREVPEFVE